MTLKFACNFCNHIIITNCLCSGDMLRCPDCGSIIRVPKSADIADEAPNLAIDMPEPVEPESPVVIKEAIAPQKPPPPPEPTMWGTKDVLKFMVLDVVGIILVYGILHLLAALSIWCFAPDFPAWPGDWPNPYHFHFFRIVSIFSDIMTIGLIYYFIVKRHHNNNFFEVLHLYKVPKRQIIKYSLISLITVILIFGLFIIIEFTPFAKEIPHNLPIDKLWKLGYPALIWATFLAPLAAIPEEIVFRGFIFLGLKKSFGLTWAAIISTLLFILLHGPQLGFSLFHLFMIGIGATVFMAIRIKTDSLTKSMLAHFYYNFILILIGWSLVIIKGISILTEIK
jgi:membrane protease YdiL (CAAX protease family)